MLTVLTFGVVAIVLGLVGVVGIDHATPIKGEVK